MPASPQGSSAGEASRLALVTVASFSHLARVLVLSRSLAAAAPTVRLHVACVDPQSEALLSGLGLSVVPASALEAAVPGLVAARRERSVSEYAWTLKPAALRHVLDLDADIDLVAHVDSDFEVYADPEPLLREELDGHSALVIAHDTVLPDFWSAAAERRFVLETRAHGTYNAGLVAFRRDDAGQRALRWWQDRCVEWCFAVPDNGRCADQKYLEDMVRLCDGVKVASDPRLALAPWNVRRHRFSGDGALRVNSDPLLLYHFQGVRLRARAGRFGTAINPETRPPAVIRKRLYAPYVSRLIAAAGELTAASPAFAPTAETTTLRAVAADALAVATAQVRAVATIVLPCSVRRRLSLAKLGAGRPTAS